MGIKYVWDTNTAIYYLQQQFSQTAEKFIDNLLETEQPIISVISEIELLCWKTAMDKDMQLLRGFIQNSLVIELEKSIKYKTADIRKFHKIKLPDAIIAATSLVYDYTLITRNVSDFKNIEGIKILNLWEQV